MTHNKGFTLIETLVAIVIFVTVMGAAVNLFVSALSSQRYVVASQRLADELSLFMESLSRALREAERDGAGTCLSPNENYSTPSSGAIRFLNSDGKCQEIFLETTLNRIGGRVSRDNSSANFRGDLPLTSNTMKVETLRFELLGQAGPPNGAQPRVTIFLEVIDRGIPAGESPRLKLQTTISKRDLDE